MEKSRLPLFHRKSKGGGSSGKSTKQNGGKPTKKPASSKPQSSKISDGSKGGKISGNKGSIFGYNSNEVIQKDGIKDDNNGQEKSISGNNSKEKLKSSVSLSDELSEKVARKRQQIGYRHDVRESNGVGNVQSGNDVQLHSIALHANTTAVIYRKSETLTHQQQHQSQYQQQQHRNVGADGVDVNSPPLLPGRGPLIPPATIMSNHSPIPQNKGYANQSVGHHCNDTHCCSINGDEANGLINNRTAMSSHFQQFRKYYEYDITGHQHNKSSTSSDPDSSPHHDYEDIDLIMARSGPLCHPQGQGNISGQTVGMTVGQQQAMRQETQGYSHQQPPYGVNRGPLPPPPPPTHSLGSRIQYPGTVTSVVNSKTYHDFSTTSSQNTSNLHKTKTGADVKKTCQIPSYNGYGCDVVSRSQSQGQEMGSRIHSQEQGPLLRTRHSSSPCSRTGVSTFKQLPSAYSCNDAGLNNVSTKGIKFSRSRKDHYQPLLSSSPLCNEGHFHRQNSVPSPNNSSSFYSPNGSHYSKNMAGMKRMGTQGAIIQSRDNTSSDQERTTDTVDGYHSYESVNSDGYPNMYTAANQTLQGVGHLPVFHSRADNLMMIKHTSGNYGMSNTSTPPDSPLDIVIPPPGGAGYFDYPVNSLRQNSQLPNKTDPDVISSEGIVDGTLMHCNINGICNSSDSKYTDSSVLQQQQNTQTLYNTQQCYSPYYKAHHHFNKVQDLVSTYNERNQLMDSKIYDKVASHSESLDSDYYYSHNGLDKNVKDYSAVILNGKEKVLTPGDRGPSYGYIYNMDGNDKHHSGFKQADIISFSPQGGRVMGDVYIAHTDLDGRAVSPVSPPYTPILPSSSTQQGSPRAITQGFYSLYSGDFTNSSKPSVPQSPHFGRKHSFPSPSCGIRMAELRAKAQRRWSDPKSPNNYSGVLDRNTPSPTGSVSSVQSFQSVPIEDSMTTITEEDKSCEHCEREAKGTLVSSTTRSTRSPYQQLLSGEHTINEYNYSAENEPSTIQKTGNLVGLKQRPANSSSVENHHEQDKGNYCKTSPIITTKESIVKHQHVNNTCSTQCSSNSNISNEDSLPMIAGTVVDVDNNKGNLANSTEGKHYQENNVSSSSEYHLQKQQLLHTNPNTNSLDISFLDIVKSQDSCSVEGSSRILLQHGKQQQLSTEGGNRKERDNFNNKSVTTTNEGDNGCIRQVFTTANQPESCVNKAADNSCCVCGAIEQSLCSCNVNQCVQYSGGSTTSGGKSTITNALNGHYYEDDSNTGGGVTTTEVYCDKMRENCVANKPHGSNSNMGAHDNKSSRNKLDDCCQDELQGYGDGVRINTDASFKRKQLTDQASQTNTTTTTSTIVKNESVKSSKKSTSHEFESVSNCNARGVGVLQQGSDDNFDCDLSERPPRGDNLSCANYESKVKSENKNINSTTTDNKNSNPVKSSIKNMKSSKLKPPSTSVNKERNEKSSGKTVSKLPKEKYGNNNRPLQGGPSKCDVNIASYAKQTPHTSQMEQKDSCVKNTQTVNKPQKLSERSNSKVNKAVSGFSKLKPPSKVLKPKGERLLVTKTNTVSSDSYTNKDILPGKEYVSIYGTSSNLGHLSNKPMSVDLKPTNSQCTQITPMSKANQLESNIKHDMGKNVGEKMISSISTRGPKSSVKTPDSEKSSIGSERNSKGRMKSRVGSYSSLSSCDPMSSLPSSRCSSQLSVDSISSDTFEYDLPRSNYNVVDALSLELTSAERHAVNLPDTSKIDCNNKIVNVHNTVDLRDNVSTCSSNNKSTSDVCKSNNSADVSRDSIDSEVTHTVNSDSINSIASVCKDLESVSSASEELLIMEGSSDISQHSNSSAHHKDSNISSNKTASKAITQSKSLSSSTSSESNISCTNTGATDSSSNKPKQSTAQSQVTTRTVPSASKTSRLRKPSAHLGKKSGVVNQSKTSLPQTTIAAKAHNNISKTVSSSSNNTAATVKQSASKMNSGSAKTNNLIGSSKEKKKGVFNRSFSRSNSSESNCSSKSTHSSVKGDVSPSSPCDINNSISNYSANKSTEKASRLRVPQASKLHKPRTLNDQNLTEKNGPGKMIKPQEIKLSSHKSKTNHNTPEQPVEYTNTQRTELNDSNINVVCNSDDNKTIAMGNTSHLQSPMGGIRQGQKSGTTRGTKVTSLNEIRPKSFSESCVLSEEISSVMTETVIVEEKSLVVDSPAEVAISNKCKSQKTFKESSVGTEVTKEGIERQVYLGNSDIAPSSKNEEVMTMMSKEKDGVISNDTNQYYIREQEEHHNKEKGDKKVLVISSESLSDLTCYTQFGDKSNKVSCNIPEEMVGNGGNLHSTTCLLNASQSGYCDQVHDSTADNTCFQVLADWDLSKMRIESKGEKRSENDKKLIGKENTISMQRKENLLNDALSDSSIGHAGSECHVNVPLIPVDKVLKQGHISPSKCEVATSVEYHSDGEIEHSSQLVAPNNDIITSPTGYKQPQVNIHPLLVKPYASLRRNHSPVPVSTSSYKNTTIESQNSRMINITDKDQLKENESEISVTHRPQEKSVNSIKHRLHQFSHLHKGEKEETMTEQKGVCVDSINRPNKMKDSILRSANNTSCTYSTPEAELFIHKHPHINWSHTSQQEQAPASQYVGSITTESLPLRSCQVALKHTDNDLDTDTNSQDSSHKKASVRSLETDSETQLFPKEAQATLPRCHRSEEISVRNSRLLPQQIASINERSGLGSVAIICDTNGVLKQERTAIEEPESTIDFAVKNSQRQSQYSNEGAVQKNTESQQSPLEHSVKTNVCINTDCKKLDDDIMLKGDSVIQVSHNIGPVLSLDHSSMSIGPNQVVTQITEVENKIQKQEQVSCLTQSPRNSCHPAQEGLSNKVKEISMRSTVGLERLSNPCNENQCKDSLQGNTVAPENISRSGVEDRCDVRGWLSTDNQDTPTKDKMDHKLSAAISQKDKQIYMKVSDKCNKDGGGCVNVRSEIKLPIDVSNSDSFITSESCLRSRGKITDKSDPLQQQHVHNKYLSENIDSLELNGTKKQCQNKSVIGGDKSALHKPLVMETQPNLIQQAGLSQGLCDSNQQHRCVQYDSYFVLNESSRYMTFPAEPFSPKRKKKISLQGVILQEPFEMRDQYIEDSYFGDTPFTTDTLFCPTVLESPSARERFNQVIPNGDMLNSLKLSESGYDSWKSQGSSSTACEADDESVLGIKDQHINLIGQNIGQMSEDSSSSDTESINGTSSASVITVKTVQSVSEKENGGVTSNEEDGKCIHNIKAKIRERNQLKDDYSIRSEGVKVVKSKMSAASRSSSESTLTSDAIKYLEWDTSYDNSLLANNKDSSSIEDLLESAELFTKAQETSESLERLLQDCDEISLYDHSFESGSLKKRLNFSGSDFALALHTMSKSPSEENVLDEGPLSYQQQQGKNTYCGLGIQLSKHSPGLIADDKKMGPQSRADTIDVLQEKSICNIYDPHETFTKTSGCQEKVCSSIMKEGEILVENNSNCKTPAQKSSQKVAEKNWESIKGLWPNASDKYQCKEYSGNCGLMGNQSVDQTRAIHCIDRISADSSVNNTVCESKTTDISQTPNHQHQVRYDKHINKPSIQSVQTEPVKCDLATASGPSVYTNLSTTAPKQVINVISSKDVTSTLDEVMNECMVLSNEQVVNEKYSTGSNAGSSSDNTLLHEEVRNTPGQDGISHAIPSTKDQTGNNVCKSPVKTKAAFFEAGISFLNDRRRQMFQKRNRKCSSETSDHSINLTPSAFGDNRNKTKQQSSLMGEQLNTAMNRDSNTNRIKEGSVTSHQPISNEEKTGPCGTNNEVGNQRFTAGLLNYRDKVLKSKAQKTPHNTKQRETSGGSNEPQKHLLSLETMVAMGMAENEYDPNHYEADCDCCLEKVTSRASFTTDSFIDLSDNNTHVNSSSSNEPLQESIVAKRHHSHSDDIKTSRASLVLNNSVKERPCSLTLSVRKSSGSHDLAIATMLYLDNNMPSEVFASNDEVFKKEKNNGETTKEMSSGFVRQRSHEEYLKSRRNTSAISESSNTPNDSKSGEDNFVPNGTLILGSVKNRKEKSERNISVENNDYLNQADQHADSLDQNQKKSQLPRPSVADSHATKANHSINSTTSQVTNIPSPRIIPQPNEPRFAPSLIPWGQKRGSGGSVMEKLKMFQGDRQIQQQKKPTESSGHKFGWNFKFRKADQLLSFEDIYK